MQLSPMWLITWEMPGTFHARVALLHTTTSTVDAAVTTAATAYNAASRTGPTTNATM